jgi:hypothetical protein
MKQLLLWGYQTRIVGVAAACYGVPQKRFRTLVIASKVMMRSLLTFTCHDLIVFLASQIGEYLPTMPPPTHYLTKENDLTLAALERVWHPCILRPPVFVYEQLSLFSRLQWSEPLWFFSPNDATIHLQKRPR